MTTRDLQVEFNNVLIDFKEDCYGAFHEKTMDLQTISNIEASKKLVQIAESYAVAKLNEKKETKTYLVGREQ
jgi:hypothetical protein